MNQAELEALAHRLPSDAKGITIAGRDSDQAFFESETATAHSSGYSPRDGVSFQVQITQFIYTRWRATVVKDNRK